MIEIDGVVPVIPIPFAPDESIHEPDLRRLVDFAVTSGAAAICLPAYGSEFYKLSEEERERVVSIAIATNRRRIPLMAQANHGSAAGAIRLANGYQRLGADVISVAIPRQFALREQDVLRYLGRIADAISIPMMVQDFNPRGVTISPALIESLNKNHPNILFVKLEEPLMISKLLEIKRRVGERVGILEGWGGYYMIELIPHGICGIMPGVPLLEPLSRVYREAKAGDLRGAMSRLGQLLPFINYTLQDFELFLQVEKRLLVKRALIESATVRDATYSLLPEEEQHVDLLCDHVLQVISQSR
jgi:dihydrodipicolinate synthase/N-acetylneuraminate lyase